MKSSRRVLSRREMLEMAAAFGCLAVTNPIQAVLAEDSTRQLTPMQTMGPFYPVLRPMDHDMDLTVIKGKRGRAEGKVIHVTGRVLNGKGDPVRGAQIEIWQANTHGRYAHPADVNPAPLDPNFQGFGVQVTDAEGRYRFKTIKPGAYPINPVNPDAVRPPHIHFDVIGKEDRLVTQMYFPGEPLNDGDIIFKELGAERDAAVAHMLPRTNNLEPDSLLFHWDIVLNKG